MAVTEQFAPADLVQLRMSKSEKHTVTTSLPSEVRDALKGDAASRDLSDNAVVREIVALHYGFRIVDNASTARIGKYAGLSKEEVNARRNAENQTKRDRMAKIMAAIEDGQIPAELLAKLGISVA